MIALGLVGKRVRWKHLDEDTGKPAVDATGEVLAVQAVGERWTASWDALIALDSGGLASYPATDLVIIDAPAAEIRAIGELQDFLRERFSRARDNVSQPRTPIEAVREAIDWIASYSNAEAAERRTEAEAIVQASLVIEYIERKRDDLVRLGVKVREDAFGATVISLLEDLIALASASPKKPKKPKAEEPSSPQ